MVARGDVVLVDFPFSGGTRSRTRPGLVIQNDNDNGRLRDTIVAMISGNTRRVHETSQLYVDPTSPEGASSGLHGPSAVICNQLFTVRQSLVTRTIGSLSDDLMDEVNECLKAALEIA